MSTDFNVVCDELKIFRHLGQQMGATHSFGNGTGDTKKQAEILEWIEEVLENGYQLRIANCHETVSEDYEDVDPDHRVIDNLPPFQLIPKRVRDVKLLIDELTEQQVVCLKEVVLGKFCDKCGRPLVHCYC